MVGIQKISKPDIVDWLQKIGVENYRDVFITRSKAKKVEELDIDLFIDDTITAAKEVLNTGIPVLMIERPWNKDFDNSRVEVVSNWKKVPVTVNEMLRERC